MIPTNSSGTTNGCDNISSNCVVWQGPDIACINLCSGDTISEVTSKIATKVCDIITNGVSANPSLAGLDLSCLNISGTTPTTLVPVLQEMVNAICSGSGSTRSSLSPSSQVQDDLPTMTLPACMQYNDVNGNPVTELRLDLFASLIANQVCTNLASINLINSTLTSYSNRLDVLEACVLPCSGAVTEVQIIPTCVSNVGNLTNVSIVVSALESAYCTLVGGTGTVAQMNLAIAQTSITSASPTRNNSGATYSSITGWQTSATTLAQSLQNAWVVIDDLYAAVGDIQTNCCSSGCDSVIFGYSTSTTVGANGLLNSVNFNFIGSTIPSSFNDSAGFSKLTLTDALGASLTQVVSVSSLQNNSNGFDFSTGSLNTQQDLSIQVQFSVTNGVDTCEATQSNTVPGVVPCPTVSMTAITGTEATVNFTNTIGTTAVYVLDVLDASNAVIATYTVNNPPASVSYQFTGLTPGTPYVIRVTVQYGGATKVCPSSAFSTSSGAAPCTNGMDVAFIIDYTYSMANEIEAIKTGVASIINTINTASGANNYRLGLVTADENNTGTPTYATSTDYLALPSAQRIINTGSNNHYQIITAWEMFQDNNDTTFTAQLNKLNSGTAPSGVPMGQGDGTPEPTDMALGQVIESSNFLNAFRNNVAKYAIIITDDEAGGDDDTFNSVDYARIGSLTTTALNNGIKVFVLGAGVNKTYNGGSGVVYPWRELSTNTGGNWNVSESPTAIQNEIIAGCS
tara:strand:- start:1197 stop:3416 length:2220 start_codon:yes stop_codon:yes gene_type:complete